MAHSLTTPPPPPPISTKSKRTILHIPSLRFQRVCSKQVLDDDNLFRRRNLALGLAGTLLGLSVGDREAKAARRPPPPPPEEKKDPNVSGVQAKVLASKKRKEAMKQAVAKLREQGRSLNGPANELVNEPSE